MDNEEKCLGVNCYTPLGIYIFKHQGTFYAQLIKKNSTVIAMGTLSRQNQTLTINKTTDYLANTPDSANAAYVYGNVLYAGNYFLQSDKGRLHNLKNGKSLYLPIADRRDSSVTNFYICDFKSYDNLSNVLYVTNNVLHLLKGEIKNDQFLKVSDNVISGFNPVENKAAFLHANGVFTYSKKLRKFISIE